MASVWEEKVKMPRFPALEGNKRTRVLIIGGGMAGLLCAHMLEGMGEDYLLVEAEEPGGGVTRNTTAKITSQHGLIYEKLVYNHGIQFAELYAKANEEAIYLTYNSAVTAGSTGYSASGIENSVRVAFAQIGRVVGTSTDVEKIQGIACQMDESGKQKVVDGVTVVRELSDEIIAFLEKRFDFSKVTLQEL